MTKRIRTIAALVCAADIVLPIGAAQADNDVIMQSEAGKLRKLEIMLMVTSLRCRGTAHDFRGEYGRFAEAHSVKLKAARANLTRGLTAQYGSDSSKRALDRMGVKMANTYGSGHPWMNCAQLKGEVQALSYGVDHGQLLSAATRLLAPSRPQTVVVAQAAPVTPKASKPYSSMQQNWADPAGDN